MATYIVQPPAVTKQLLSSWLFLLKWLHLYTNDLTPARADDDITVYTEATATGYVRQDMASGWSPPAVDASFVAHSDHADFVFTVTADSAPQFVYGWYAEDSLGRLCGAQRGEGSGFPFRFYLAGDTVTVRIRLTQESYGPPPPPAP